jgi:hypothetical protein
MYNNIIITATNSSYYDSLLTLISSIHENSIDIVNQIFVYNLGLEETEKSRLATLKNVSLIDFPEEAKKLHPKFLEPKSYIYKIYCMYQSHVLAENILWIDSGACLLKPINMIYEKINKNHIFLVGDIHLNKNYTHDNCIECVSATEQELNCQQIWAGLIGYKSNGIYHHIFKEAYSLSLIPGCLDGNQQNHRHDQSILSILTCRHNCPREDIDMFGYWTDANRNLNTAQKTGSVIFAHRRGYSNKKHLKYKEEE